MSRVLNSDRAGRFHRLAGSEHQTDEAMELKCNVKEHLSGAYAKREPEAHNTETTRSTKSSMHDLKGHYSLSPLSTDAVRQRPPKGLGINHTPSIAFRHLPPNSAKSGYATERALFFSAQLSIDAVSACE